MARRDILRPKRFDDLGLKRALSDRMLPLLVAAMTFLAVLTLSAVLAAAALGQHWRQGAAAVLTVQVPQPHGAGVEGSRAEGSRVEGSRVERAVSVLRGTPGVAQVRVLTDEELADLLQPWLGNTAQSVALPLPAVIEVRLVAGEAEPDPALQARLQSAVPGAFLESHGEWLRRLSLLARSLQACAVAALLLVAGVAAAVVAVATRAGLVARRDAISIVHGLGATDGYIAYRFANRATALTAAGSCIGALVALPVLLALAQLAAPFSASETAGVMDSLPLTLWLSLPLLPAAAAGIGWLTAQGTVRRWLRRLP